MKDPEAIFKIILDEAFFIHKKIGPGMLENVYKHCLAHRVRKRGLEVELEKPIPIVFEEVKLECGYRADLVVEKCVVVEIKNIEGIGLVQISQMVTYLRWLDIRLGLILNFYVPFMKEGIKRVSNFKKELPY